MKPLILLVALLSLGCATRVIPPAPQDHFVPVHIVDYGDRASLILPEDIGPVEYAFGNWNTLAMGENNSIDGLAGLMMSAPGALGQRILPPNLSPDQFQSTLKAKRVLTLSVDPEKAHALSKSFHNEFQTHENQKHYNPVVQMTFIPVDQKYSLAQQDFSIVSDWLTALGCQVPDAAFSADYKIQPPQ